MNVLMIATELLPVPPVKGGAIQTYIAGVAPLLAEHHNLTIVGIQDPSLSVNEVINQIRYVRLPGQGQFEIYQDEIIKFLQTNSFDLIHIFNRPLIASSIRAVAPHSRIILSMHNDMFDPHKISIEAGTDVIQQSEQIITVSDYVGRKISTFFPQASSKVRTIYSGVDLNRFVPYDKSPEAQRIREQLRKENNLGSKKVILFAGRLSPNKGVDILVRSMYELAQKYKDIALVIVGSRWYSDDKVTDYVAYIRALVARLSIPVVTTGFVNPNEIHKWFWVGDIFVCPSQWQEPLARVHYEAMASGLPIITTARGGNPEVIIEGGNGFIISQPEDPSAFVEKLSLLLSDQSLGKKMGYQGYNLAKERYSWKRVAEEILQVWSTPALTSTTIAAKQTEQIEQIEQTEQIKETKEIKEIKEIKEMKKIKEKEEKKKEKKKEKEMKEKEKEDKKKDKEEKKKEKEEKKKSKETKKSND